MARLREKGQRGPLAGEGLLEDELVVAIFKRLELNPTVYPEVGSILRHFKQHRVKLLSQDPHVLLFHER